jgi:3-oxoacyl-[acyl-carrier-protein] synthase II
LQEYTEKGAALAPPQLFAESVANAPGSHIAIEHGLRGFNITITQRESSALAAAMVAAMQLAKGSVDAALVGGVEEANEMLFSVLDRLGALAHAEPGLDEAARPFDRRRNGFVLGEGGAAIVLGAGRRAPYAWLSGFGIAHDTTATTSDWGSDAQSVTRAMRGAIEDAEITLDQVDAIFASANGSRRGDALEERAIHALFGARIPPIVATKGLFGEYAAGGALQLAAALLALEDQILPSSPGFEEGDLPVTRETQPAALQHLLINSVSAGGGVVCAIASRSGEVA